MKGLADVMLHLWIIPKPESSSGTNSIPLVDPVPNGDGPIPVCRYVNLVLFLPPGPTLRPGNNFETHLNLLTALKNLNLHCIFYSWFTSHSTIRESSGRKYTDSQPVENRG